MINRTVIPAPSWPAEHKRAPRAGSTVAAPARVREDVHSEPVAGAASPLLRFLIVLVFACALTSIYLWQLSEVSTLQRETTDLRTIIAEKEKENTTLMVDVGVRSAPAEVEKQARALGMGVTSQLTYVTVDTTSPSTDAAVAPASTDPAPQLAVASSMPDEWWRQLVGRLVGP